MLAFFKSQKGRSGMEMPQIVAYGRIFINLMRTDRQLDPLQSANAPRRSEKKFERQSACPTDGIL